jgi:2,3-bisphosphoglycerate-independent phosphoglycerate mutase
LSEPLVLPEAQVDREGGRGRIVLIVMDGLGGLPHPKTGRTELESARTPHMDELAGRSSLGLMYPVQAGITPGSGPAHLSLFGYDPRRYVIGRGALSALGVGLELEGGDVAARLNLATFDEQGRVTDRRAGRPKDADAQRVVEKLMAGLVQPKDARISLVPEKEHRVVLLIRGEGLGAELTDTDPLEEGRGDLPMEATSPGSARAAEIVKDFLAQARSLLADEPAMNGFLARGWASFETLPSMERRFGLRGTAIAKYPMYRGVARLVGMTIDGVPEDVPGTAALFERLWGGHDLYFMHFKDPDSRGHDGDFDGKVAAIEAVDAQLPRVLAKEPDVVIVTGDHSTPAALREHSWHGVPTLLASRWARPSAKEFGESACRTGDLGHFHGTDLVPLALAHAGRLVKFGA